jgi:hypothetical protein
MNDATEHELRWEPFVGRGVLGGMMGMFIVAMVAMALMFTGAINFNLTGTFVVLLVFVFVSGSLYGVGIGYIIYRITKQRAAQLSTLKRILIGAGIAFSVGIVHKADECATSSSNL